MPLESSSDPIWGKLVKQLVPLIWRPMTPEEVVALATKELGWSHNVTSNVLAMAEGPYVYFKNGQWHRYSHHRGTKHETSDA